MSNLSLSIKAIYTSSMDPADKPMPPCKRGNPTTRSGKRLGHLNQKDLLIMSRSRAVSGLKIRNNFELPTCEVCITQKLTNSSFSSRIQRSQHCLDIIYFDFWIDANQFNRRRTLSRDVHRRSLKMVSNVFLEE